MSRDCAIPKILSVEAFYKLVLPQYPIGFCLFFKMSLVIEITFRWGYDVLV